MLTTTLQTIWNLLPKDENGEADSGSAQLYWQGLLEALGKTRPDDDPVTLLWILENCGMKSALATTDSFPGHSRAIRLYACRCARYAQPFIEHYSEVKALRLAIEAAEKLARGLGNADEMADAASQIDFDQPPYYWQDIAISVTISDDSPDFAHIVTRIYQEVIEVVQNLPGRLNPYSLAGDAAEAKCREDLRREFIRLCKLEGEYGEVDLLDKT